ncbi:hypothetical protein MBLNU230_g2628t1 [Neophaeotheca triangularis]
MPGHTKDSAHGQPSETSPLLSKDGPQPVEPGSGIAPDGQLANASVEGSAKPQNGEDEGDNHGSTLERQASAEDRQKQYEGIPEIKAKMKYIMPAVAIGIFLSAADQTLIVSSYAKIGGELQALNRTSWIATAYFLTLTSFQPLYGKTSDVFGRKACLLFAYTVFGLGCLCCGLAQSMTQLIAARAFAGIGGGGMTTVVSILLSDAVSLRERGKYQGYVNIVYASGAGFGAPLGGILSDTIGWRWAFLMQAPMCLAAFIAVYFVINLPKADSADWRAKLKRIDFPGAAILICAVFALLLGLDRGSNAGWDTKIAIISLSVSLPLFLLFLLVEIKFAREPFAPGHIIFHRSLFACYLCNFFAFSGWLAAMFYIPLYFQAVDNLSAQAAGIRLIPGILCGVSGSLLGGFYMQKTGRFYWITVAAYTALTAGMTVIFLCSGILTTSIIGIILGMCLDGFGNGIGVTTTLIGLISNASHEDQAIATACSYLFRSLGSVFGISMSATVANSQLRRNLASALPRLGLDKQEALDIADNVRQSLDYLQSLEPRVKAVVIEAYAGSTSAAFALQIGLVAGAAVSAWFIREKALGGK